MGAVTFAREASSPQRDSHSFEERSLKKRKCAIGRSALGRVSPSLLMESPQTCAFSGSELISPADRTVGSLSIFSSAR